MVTKTVKAAPAGTAPTTQHYQNILGHHPDDKAELTTGNPGRASGTGDNPPLRYVFNGQGHESFEDMQAASREYFDAIPADKRPAAIAEYWRVRYTDGEGYQYQGLTYPTLEEVVQAQQRHAKEQRAHVRRQHAEFWESHGGQPKPVTRDYSLRRLLMESWRNDRWRPFGAFVDLAWSETFNGWPQPDQGVLYSWRILRPRVLRELAALGLVGSVRLTNGEVEPLSEHDGRVAGHVVIAAVGQVSEPTGVPESAYERALAARFGLAPHSGLDTGLRAFCGQLTAPDDDHRLDHSRTWVDRWGDPVLTAELYGLEHRPEYAGELRELFGQLPIVVRAEGVEWGDVLHEVLIIEHDPEKPPLDSDLDSGEAGWKAQHAEAMERYMEAERRRHIAALEKSRPKPPPGHRPLTNTRSLKGTFRTVVAATPLDQPSRLDWAAGVVMQHVIYGELTMKTALEMLGDVAALTSIDPEKAEQTITHRANMARIQAGRVDL